jgi:hypothetical protein
VIGAAQTLAGSDGGALEQRYGRKRCGGEDINAASQTTCEREH